MKKNFEHVLLDTRMEFEYEEYLEFCECNDIEPAADNSREFWDWESEERSRYFDDDMDNLKDSDEGNVPCVITGSAGLWYGRREIMPIRCESLYDAIELILKKSDVDDVKVTNVNGIIHFYGYHHDGTNHYCIQKLTNRGINELCNDYDGVISERKLQRYHTKLFPEYVL